MEPSKKITVQAPAKINVSLRVVGKREDGYHELEMTMVPLTLCDTVEIELLDDAMDTLVLCDAIKLDDPHKNLCWKAVNALRKEVGFKENFRIKVEKRIPSSAGMGGGSSDAASTIKGVIQLLGLSIDAETLLKIGAQVGADVPFFFVAKPCLVTGIGEKLKPIRMEKRYRCLVAQPSTGLSTKEIFDLVERFPSADVDTSGVLKALGEGVDELLSSSMGNDLYLPAASLLPDIRIILDVMKNEGLSISMMTGSGSCVFALSDEVTKLEKAKEKLEEKGFSCLLTEVVNE